MEHKPCPCGAVAIFADTEDWDTPLCYGCWTDNNDRKTFENIRENALRKRLNKIETDLALGFLIGLVERLIKIDKHVVSKR